MERKTLIITFSLVIMIMAKGMVLSKNYYGQPNDYLQYGVGARALAMGGAYSGLANEASAGYWNPAGLALMDEFEISSMYASFFEGTSLNFIASAHPLGPKIGTFAITDVLLYSGGFEERDYLNNLISDDESIVHNTIICSYARKMGRVCAGINLKLVQEKDMGYAGSGYGFDLGGMYQFSSVLRVGMMLANIVQPRIILREEENIYKMNFKGGVSMEPFKDKITMTIDANRLEGEDVYYCGGMEISPWGKLVNFRVGLNHLSEITYGLGVSRGPVGIDYGYSGHESLGDLHRVSFSLKWFNLYRGKAVPKLKKKGQGKGEYVLEGLHNELQFEIGELRFEARMWSLEITDELDGEVRNIKGEHQPPKMVIWDMKDDAGRPVKEGLYHYKFRVLYKDDKEWVEKGKVNVRFSVPVRGEVEMEMRGREGEVETEIEKEIETEEKTEEEGK